MHECGCYLSAFSVMMVLMTLEGIELPFYNISSMRMGKGKE